MILPSNSSIRYFPENTTTSFTTELPQQINLPGQWEVALTEIQFPCSFLHIRPGEGWVTILSFNKEIKTLKTATGNITPGVYSRLPDLLQALNAACAFKILPHIVWQFDPQRGEKIFLKLSCEKECPYTYYVQFSEKLRRILGFDIHRNREKLITPDLSNLKDLRYSRKHPDFSKIPKDELFYEISSPTQELIADVPASVVRGLPDKLFIYCDICEPYVTGDVHSPLLRVVSLIHENNRYSFGCNSVRNFSPVNYIPLRITCFRTIEIDIRDQTGERIPFEFGTLTVTLQFRRTD